MGPFTAYFGQSAKLLHLIKFKCSVGFLILIGRVLCTCDKKWATILAVSVLPTQQTSGKEKHFNVMYAENMVYEYVRRTGNNVFFQMIKLSLFSKCGEFNFGVFICVGAVFSYLSSSSSFSKLNRIVNLALPALLSPRTQTH